MDRRRDGEAGADHKSSLDLWIAPVCHCLGHKNQRFEGAAVGQPDEGADQSG